MMCVSSIDNMKNGNGDDAYLNANEEIFYCIIIGAITTYYVQLEYNMRKKGRLQVEYYDVHLRL